MRPRVAWLYGPAVPKSPILPLAAAVTAVALGASPALAAPFSPGKRDEARVVAFPLLAVKGQAPLGAGFHVSHSSHSSHVSGAGGHSSHVSHASHVSSVPAPAPASTAPAAPPPQPAAPSPAVIGSSGGLSGAAPSQSALMGSPGLSGSGSPVASSGHGCAFVIFAPFTAAAGAIRRLADRRGRPR